MELRPYQQDFITKVRHQAASGQKRIIGALSTGAGKTVIASELFQASQAKGKRGIFIVHLDALVGQTADKFDKFGIHPGFIKRGWPEDKDALIQIASVQTMSRRGWWRSWHPDFVIWDEAHISSFSKIGREAIETWSHAIHIGLTATPCRTKRTEGMHELWDCIVTGPSTADLQSEGHLVEMEYYSTPIKPNLNKLKSSSGDYQVGQLSGRMNTPEMIEDAIAQWRKFTPDEKTIVFCVDVSHAEATCAAFNEQGVSARAVLGNTKNRKELYEEFARGEFTVLVSVNVVAIGFDEPSVMCGILMRPTKSLALHIQQVGRVMRISPITGKTHGTIIDQAGNCIAHGLPEDIISWELDEPKTKGEGEAPTKNCPKCHAIVLASQKSCKCGYEFPTLVAEAKPQELAIVLPSAPQGQEEQFEFYRRELQSAYQKGRLPGFALMRFKERYGQKPAWNWSRGAVFGGNSTPLERAAYTQYLLRFIQAGKKDKTWGRRQFSNEFGKAATKPHELNYSEAVQLEISA